MNPRKDIHFFTIQFITINIILCPYVVLNDLSLCICSLRYILNDILKVLMDLFYNSAELNGPFKVFCFVAAVN